MNENNKNEFEVFPSFELLYEDFTNWSYKTAEHEHDIKNLKKIPKDTPEKLNLIIRKYNYHDYLVDNYKDECVIPIPNSEDGEVRYSYDFTKFYSHSYFNEFLNYETELIKQKRDKINLPSPPPPPIDKKEVEQEQPPKEMHNNIFKGNAFEVFEMYHINKSLVGNNRTDLRLLFQLFKKDTLFVDTIELKHYIQWLNKTYGYDLTELKIVDIKTKPNRQRINDYKAYKKATLK